MLFTDATVDDLPMVVEIYNSTVPGRLVTADTEPVSVSDKLHWFHAHNPATRPLWIVRDNDEIIGWVSYNSFYGRPAYDGTAEISIYLHTNARNKGYGKMILQYCLGEASRLNIHTLLGFIFKHNEPSIRLFKQAGFAEWGDLPDIAIMDGRPFSLLILGKKI